MSYPTEQIKELHNQINAHLQKEEYEDAISIVDKIISNKITIDASILPLAKVEFASIYIHIADNIFINLDKISKAEKLTQRGEALINKAFGIFNQYENSLPKEMKLFIQSNRARAYLIRYDNKYKLEQIQKGERIITYDEVNSIYDIKETISESIRIYWEALKISEHDEETYNIRNNLANALSRTGRYVETLSLLEKNINLLPHRWQSKASLADALANLVDNAFIPQTASLFCVRAENYLDALDNSLTETEKRSINFLLDGCKTALKKFGYDFSETILKANRIEENLDYEKHTEFRKFVLKNKLSLSEHSLYCKCRDTVSDNLKIGTLDGSIHLSKKKVFPILDGLINRILSEFANSRLLYYNYASGLSFVVNDIEFSKLSNNDLLGYSIEQLRACYRIAYGILDKISNGILLLFEIEKHDSVSYFENVFDIYKDNLKGIQNIHLASLYSIALDLNKDIGSLKYFKVLRNEMEHGYLVVNELKNISEIKSISEIELKGFTYELLQLTRSAIFSFVFLIRSRTIIIKNIPGLQS